MSGQVDGKKHRDSRSPARRARDFKDQVLRRFRRGKVLNPIPNFPVTYPYGVRNPDYAAGFHTGEDHSTNHDEGKRAIAVSHGRVVYAGWDHPWGSDYGMIVVYQVTDPQGHNKGREYRLGYCHLSRVHVKEGDRVSPGHHIADTGDTGNSTAPHCHIECRVWPFSYGDVVDPINAKALMR